MITERHGAFMPGQKLKPFITKKFYNICRWRPCNVSTTHIDIIRETYHVVEEVLIINTLTSPNKLLP